MSLFKYHGPLPPDSPMFHGRQSELNRLLRHCRGEVDSYVILYGGRQSGKTSLLTRFAHQLPPTIKKCRVDFQHGPRASKERVYTYVGYRVARELGQPYRRRDMPPLTDEFDLTEFLIEQLEAAQTGRLVLMLEELGRLDKQLRHDLANVLRAMFTNRFDPYYQPLSKMMVILAGSIEMYDLAVTDVSPLQNVCDPIYLTDLQQGAVVDLITMGLYDSGLVEPAVAERLGRAVYGWGHGQPYFTQRLGYLIETLLAQGAWVTPAQTVQQAKQQLFADDPLLKHLHATVAEYDLWAACRELLTEEIRFGRLGEDDLVRLELAGVAGNRGGYWRVRNRLLGQALQQWLVNPTEVTAQLTQLDPAELGALCYDWPPLWPVYQQFGPAMSHEQRLAGVVGYCQQHALFAALQQQLG